MKSNITLFSQSRIMEGEIIPQETATGNLSLTALQSCYDKARLRYEWSAKSVQEILSYKANRERIFYILEDQGLITSSLNEFMESVDSQGIVKTLKKLKVYKTSGARSSRAVYCNPYVWILIAMEMNPKLYAAAVRWLTDQLILNRIESGDLYKDLSKAVSVFPGVDYSVLAKSLNHVVFGRHETGIRNTGSEAQLKELRDLELNLAFAVNSGLLRSFDALLDHIRTLWKIKQKALSVAA
jgi:hypothetical protein